MNNQKSTTTLMLLVGIIICSICIGREAGVTYGWASFGGAMIAWGLVRAIFNSTNGEG